MSRPGARRPTSFRGPPTPRRATGFPSTAALAAAVLTGACADGGAASAPLDPSFAPLFAPVAGDLMTISSPALADLDGDGSPDIVFGTGVDRLRPAEGRYAFSGEPEIPGTVVAVSGRTGERIWEVPNPGDAFTTARFLDVTGDGAPDVVMGGREGAFSAYASRDGTLLWRTDPAHVAETPFPYNFFTPAVVGDLDGDGVADLLVVYGGDDTRPPRAPRDPSYIVLISGADGAVLAVHQTPDGNESYASVVSYERTDGEPWFVFGTGGETHGGAAFRAPVGSLLDGTFAARAERLIEPGQAKGVMAPATLLDVTDDGELDLVLSTFDGRLVAVEGASGAPLWERTDEGEESYHPAAPARLDAEGRLGLLVSRGIGVFPRYAGTVHRLHDARTGEVLFEHRDTHYPAGAPLAVDLTGDGVDELLFFSVRYPSAEGARVYVRHGASGRLIAHEIDGNHWSTPVIADPQGRGTLELIGLTWRLGGPPPGSPADRPPWRDLAWELVRLDLGADVPPVLTWAGYMGTRGDGHAADAGAGR